MRTESRLYAPTAIALGAALAFAVVLSPTPARAMCGNGVVDSGEDCDPTEPDAEDCCTETCTFVAQGEDCIDGEVCTVNTKCDGLGECAGGNSAPSNTPCHNSFECVERTCNNKACTGPITSDICDDDNACTLDICANPANYPNPATSCSNANLVAGTDCSGGSQQCDTSICDGNGACVPGMAPDGAGCDTDDSACTHEECDGAGNCELIDTEDCSGEDPVPVCKFWECNTTTGICEKKNHDQGTDCTDDGKDCTSDKCGTSGRCRHTAVQAGTICYEDANSCSTEFCNTKGKCSEGSAYPTIYRGHGSPCDDPNTTAVEGNDGNTCTIDYCKSQGGGTTNCAHEGTISGTTVTTNGDACTDLNTCSATSECLNGACKAETCVGSGNCAFLCGNPACGTDPSTNCGCGG